MKVRSAEFSIVWINEVWLVMMPSLVQYTQILINLPPIELKFDPLSLRECQSLSLVRGGSQSIK